MTRRVERLLAVWSLAALVAGVAVVTTRAEEGNGGRVTVDAAGDPAMAGWAPGTTSSTELPATTTTAAPSTTAAPRTGSPTTAKPKATTKPAASDGSGVPMPPGPWTPRTLPAGYVPTVGDNFPIIMPNSPQSDDAITRVAGQPYTYQGRITDEAGHLLFGICIEVHHKGFGPKQVTGADGVFRFVADPEAEPRPALGVWVDIWDCTPGNDPGWYPSRTPIGNLLTPGDTSTWFYRLMPASRLEGVIVDDTTGLPLAGMCAETAYGATQDLDDRTIRSAPTGADGRFGLSLISPWDNDVRAVPCGNPTEWQGLSQRFPFRAGTTISGATLRAAPPIVWPPA